ncbi:YndJ family protein [Actinocorallia sp. A-T 12471]|uniref:YndJ family protein n=1 Tax=Actinocorallia sp. A-T 12471 TaxID=3089813 RepID=UPI0029CC2090|nr:YndJ family protein [Actinocorallia sp. A-T 12471]MDX6743439.1 YndJ family protein [Actinocorallia sp. A-T 12471]
MSFALALIICLGMLAVVPLGLSLADAARLQRPWLAGALPGATSLFLPVGTPAALLASLYALATAILLAEAVRRLPSALRDPRQAAFATALGTPAVAALALVAERAGHPLLGYSPTMLALTVAHFHFAGFAAALIAGLVCRPEAGRAGRLAALTVPAGTLGVLGGYFVGQWAEFAGAVVLTAGMWLAALLCWRTGKAALRIAGAVLVPSMLLALWYAWGEASGIAHPGIGWMTATHGVANAVGFGLCGVLGWRSVREVRA